MLLLLQSHAFIYAMKPQSALVLRNLRCSIHSQSQTLTSSRLSFKPTRTFHYSHNPFSTAPSSSSSAPTSRRPPISHPRPVSNEDTQTDFSILNVLGNTPPPTTAIDACLSDGFHFDNGMKIGGGDGCLLLAGEAFAWRPWEAGGSSEKGKMINKTARMLNTKDQWGVADEAWGALDLVWPRPGNEAFSFAFLSFNHTTAGHQYDHSC